MAEAYSFETRDTAEELYVEHGYTYEQLVEALQIGRSTLLKWGADREWKSRRDEYLEAQRNLKQSLRKLRQAMLAKASVNLDPQDVYAVIRLEKLAEEKRRKPEDDGAKPDIDRPKVFLEDLEFVANVLKDVDPEGLKVFARNFEEIVKRFKEQAESAK